MEIKKVLLNPTMYQIKCPYDMKPERIVVHNTSNNASALSEIKYMINNNNRVSFHFAVDDKEIIQGIPLNRSTWNSGDGINGIGNRKCISIEICYSKLDNDLNKFIQAEKNAVKLIVKLLKEYNWTIDRVTKHQDYSGKYCPHRTLDLGWDRFIQMIKKELNNIEMVKQDCTNIEIIKSTIKPNLYRTRKEIQGEIENKDNFVKEGYKYPLLEITKEKQIDGYHWGKIVVNDKIVYIQMDMDYMKKVLS